jgi:hypothetical protein
MPGGEEEPPKPVPVESGMLCSKVQEVVVRGTDWDVLVRCPVPVKPLVAMLEFAGVVYGGVVTVWDTEAENDSLTVPVWLVLEVELERDEREVAKPLFPVVEDAMPVPVGGTEKVEFDVGYGAVEAPKDDETRLPEILDDE